MIEHMDAGGRVGPQIKWRLASIAANIDHGLMRIFLLCDRSMSIAQSCRRGPRILSASMKTLTKATLSGPTLLRLSPCSHTTKGTEGFRMAV